jgi:hypothetical protein
MKRREGVFLPKDKKRFGKYIFIRLAMEGASFFTKHEKREGVFSPKAQKWYV